MYIGIDVGDVKINLGLVNDIGEASFESTFPIEASQNSDKLMLDIIYIIKSISETVPLGLFNDKITGIGICTQDTLVGNKGQFQKIIQNCFDIPVIVDTLTNAMSLTGADHENLESGVGNAGIIAAGLLCKGKV